MDFLNQFKQIEAEVEEMEKSRIQATLDLKDYFDYVLKEIKSNNNHEKWLDSPRTRKKKMNEAAQTENIVEEPSASNSRRGRSAAKKVLVGNVKIEENKNKKNNKRMLENEENEERSTKTIRVSDREQNAIANKAEVLYEDNSKLNKKTSLEMAAKTTTPTDDIDADEDDKTIVLHVQEEKENILSKQNDEKENLLKINTEVASNEVKVNAINEGEEYDKTLVTSGVDLFEGCGSSTVVINPDDHKTGRMIVLVEPLTAEQISEASNFSHKNSIANNESCAKKLVGDLEKRDVGKQTFIITKDENILSNKSTLLTSEHISDNSNKVRETKFMDKNESCATKSCNLESNQLDNNLSKTNAENDIANETTVLISSDKNHIPNVDNEILAITNDINIGNIESIKETTSTKIKHKSSSEEWIEKLITKNELPSADDNAVSIPKIKKKPNICPLSEPSKTRVKEIVNFIEGSKQASTTNLNPAKSKKVIQSIGEFKENATPRLFTASETKLRKIKPLSNINRIYTVDKKQSNAKLTPLKAISKIPAMELKKREEEMLKKKQKEEDAAKVKEQKIKAKAEELKKKSEYKRQKVNATREAVEKEKQQTLAKLEKEREEKEKAVKAEIEKFREEQMLKKKRLNLQKAQEAEERRKKEEMARKARLKELEEEQKKQAELRLKQQEEADRLLQQRKLEENRANEASKTYNKPEKTIKTKNHPMKASESYDITPHKLEREPIPLKDEEDYDINDLEVDDSEDESNPRKQIPRWAEKSERQFLLLAQFDIDERLKKEYFVCPSKTPNLREFFGKYTRERARTSSAVWKTPPRSS